MKVWEPPQKRARTAGDDDGSGDDDGGGAAASARASRAVAARSEAAPGSLRTLKADILRMSAEFLGKEVPFHLGGSGAQAKRECVGVAGQPHAAYRCPAALCGSAITTCA